ncbi:MAG TPA: FAD-dependent oxidoreductase, partial [Alphaproteobacteria bacterium]|nr:FAD-dependent oxidoreductase [Alphaproteobacteria bacterium]
LVLTYAMHWPSRQRETARGLRRTPFYQALKSKGAVYSEMQGWERPSWFAPKGVAPVHDYAFGKPNWFDHAQSEQTFARNGVVMIDYSMLGKHMVEGPDAENFLQRVLTNDVSLPDGRVTYSLMLNERGGIEGDVTIARHNKTRFMVMSAISHTRRNRDHLQNAILADEDVVIRDVTSAYAVLALSGPLSRAVLETL